MPCVPSSSGTRFASSTGDKLLLIIALGGVGVALGFLVPWLGAVAASFPIPFGEPIEKLSAFDSPLVVTLRPVIGAALGAVAGFLLGTMSPEVTIDSERVLVRKNGETRMLPKSEIAGVYRKGGTVVIETQSGRVLFNDEIEGSRSEVAEAFVAHGYPWEMASQD